MVTAVRVLESVNTCCHCCRMQELVLRRQLKQQVPGAAAAWESAVQRWGKLSLRTAGFGLHSKAVMLTPGQRPRPPASAGILCWAVGRLTFCTGSCLFSETATVIMLAKLATLV